MRPLGTDAAQDRFRFRSSEGRTVIQELLGPLLPDVGEQVQVAIGGVGCRPEQLSEPEQGPTADDESLAREPLGPDALGHVLADEEAVDRLQADVEVPAARVGDPVSRVHGRPAVREHERPDHPREARHLECGEEGVPPLGVPRLQRTDVGGEREEQLLAVPFLRQIAQRIALGDQYVHAEEAREGDRGRIAGQHPADLLDHEEVDPAGVVQPRAHEIDDLLQLRQRLRGHQQRVAEQPDPPDLEGDPRDQEDEGDPEHDRDDDGHLAEGGQDEQGDGHREGDRRQRQREPRRLRRVAQVDDPERAQGAADGCPRSPPPAGCPARWAGWGRHRDRAGVVVTYGCRPWLPPDRTDRCSATGGRTRPVGYIDCCDPRQNGLGAMHSAAAHPVPGVDGRRAVGVPERLSRDRVEDVGPRRLDGHPHRLPGTDDGARREEGLQRRAPGRLDVRCDDRRRVDRHRHHVLPPGVLDVRHDAVERHRVRIGAAGRVGHVLGPQPEDDVPADVLLQRGRDRSPQRQCPRADLEAGLPAAHDQLRGEEPDRRSPDEPGHQEVDRPLVEVPSPAGLDDGAPGEQDHPVGDREPLGLVVGDVEGGHAQRPDHRDDLPADLDPLLRVEVAERLVEQERVGRLDQRVPDADQPALTPRQLAGPAGEQPAQPQLPDAQAHTLLPLGLGQVPELEPPLEVVRHVEEGDEAARLEHHDSRRSPVGRSVTRRPRTNTSPALSLSRPATARRNVVLPLPDGPRITSSSPSSACRVTSRSTGVPSRRTVPPTIPVPVIVRPSASSPWTRPG